MTQKREPTRRTLREQTAQYVVGTQGRPVAVLLTLEEYGHYLDLLDDEADSQDAQLTARLAQASKRPARKHRPASHAPLAQVRSFSASGISDLRARIATNKPDLSAQNLTS
jgi:PHD/YefM family antitoxin component YafN of YafNO toxin-antitoxin module